MLGADRSPESCVTYRLYEQIFYIIQDVKGWHLLGDFNQEYPFVGFLKSRRPLYWGLKLKTDGCL